jgi:glycosyltransferase involved in cell wall biosynthesis
VNAFAGVSADVVRDFSDLALKGGYRIPVVVAGPGAPIVPNPPARDWHAELRLCYVGRLDINSKRITDLVLVVEALANGGVKAKLTIIGTGAAAEELRRRMMPFVEDGRVVFLGQLSPEEVWAALGEEHIFLLPSAYEGLSGALLEAMSHQIAPISTKVSGSVDVIEDGVNGFLVSVGDISAMASRIGLLDNDRVALRQMALEARKSVQERFSTEAVVVDVLKLARSVRDDTSVLNVGAGSRWASAGILWDRILEHPAFPNRVVRGIRRVNRVFRRTVYGP